MPILNLINIFNTPATNGQKGLITAQSYAGLAYMLCYGALCDSGRHFCCFKKAAYKVQSVLFASTGVSLFPATGAGKALHSLPLQGGGKTEGREAAAMEHARAYPLILLPSHPLSQLRLMPAKQLALVQGETLQSGRLMEGEKGSALLLDKPPLWLDKVPLCHS